jgi:F-type H+-transporting ATPase subunit delta|tara:strand:+ start:5573 stop:6127 length:555 start_codon:yes stop_codon:yes gene_type:complete
MKTSRAAIRYAKALILESVEKNNLEQTFGDMKMVLKTFEENSGLSHLIESRVIKNSVKSSSLLLVFKEMSALTKNLIRVLDDNNRINLFEIIAYKFIELYKQHKGIQSAIVTSAVPLNKEIEDQVLDAISKLTNKQTTILNKVDSSLIGGFVLRLGDIQYNASFKNKLKNIKQEFNKNTNLSIT